MYFRNVTFKGLGVPLFLRRIFLGLEMRRFLNAGTMTGTEYERFILQLLKAIAESGKVKISEILHQKTYKGMSGREWRVDLSYEFEVMNMKYLVFIECKHWNRHIDVNPVSWINECVKDCGAQKGAVATTIGFTSPALNLARNLGVTTIITKDKIEPEFLHFTGDELSFDELNSNFEYTDVDTSKITRGKVYAQLDFIEFMASRIGELSYQIFLSNDTSFMDRLTDEQLINLNKQINNGIRDYQDFSRVGLPADVIPTIEYNQQLLFFYMLVAQRTLSS
jgi:hypothetical protein